MMDTQQHTPFYAAAEELINNLGSLFSDRAFDFDSKPEFVQKNYDDLQEARFFSLAIPVELGGGGLSYSELCQICQQLAQYCGSTALAFAMHSHPVATNVFKSKRGDEKAINTLKKIAANELIIAGTGSNDVILENVFLPEAAIIGRRPAGKWHGLWDTILLIALPLITATYFGMAERAAALADMIRLQDEYGFTPNRDLTNAILTRKTLATQAIRNVVEQACVLVGGAGFFHGHPLERITRDVRALHFHPLPEHKQTEFSGRLALGLDPVCELTR